MALIDENIFNPNSFSIVAANIFGVQGDVLQKAKTPNVSPFIAVFDVPRKSGQELSPMIAGAGDTPAGRTAVLFEALGSLYVQLSLVDLYGPKRATLFMEAADRFAAKHGFAPLERRTSDLAEPEAGEEGVMGKIALFPARRARPAPQPVIARSCVAE